MVPKLRFKNYNRIEEKKIINFAPLQRGYDLPVSQIEDGDYPVVFSNGILKKHSKYKVKGPGIVTGRSGTIGKVTYVKGNFWPHNTSLFVTDFFDNIPKYVYYYYQHIDFSKFSTGSGVPTLNRNDLHSLTVLVPAIEEQTKIADFLSSVDEKITLLNKQYDLLCQYKKGMMQKIFSQALRFKDDNGEVFPGWIKNRLGNVVTFFNGRAYKQTEWENNGVPVIRLQNLTGSGSEYYYSNLKLPDHQYCNYGDLLYMWSATMGPVWWKGSKAIFHYHIWKVISVPEKSTEDFIYYILDNITQKMLSEANGTTMAHITKAGIEKKVVNLPSIKEQIKIAKFLSAIDDKVSLKKAELDKLKTWKQGLLQQMFV